MDYSPTQLREKLFTLPEELQEAITSVDTSDTIDLIGKKYGLFFDQVGILGTETTLVMLGITVPTNFINILVNKLSIDKEKAGKIILDLNENIFSKIKEQLRGLHNTKSDITPKKEQTQPTREDLLKNIENPEGMNL